MDDLKFDDWDDILIYLRVGNLCWWFYLTPADGSSAKDPGKDGPENFFLTKS
ncbi:MAG: hypothetical protein ABII88_03070 [Candidatus Omnitrophota bacterium]